MAANELIDDPPLRRRKSFLRRRSTQRRVLPWLVIILLFAIWELVVRLAQIEPFVLPAPSAIFAAGWQWRWPILDNAWQTFMTTAIGFFIAVVFGLLAGIAIGSSTLVYDGFYPALIGFNTIPKVAVIPILVIWFGVGTVRRSSPHSCCRSFHPGERRDRHRYARARAARRVARARRVALAGHPEGRTAALDAVFLRFAQGRHYRRLRGVHRFGDGRRHKGIGHLMLVASSRFEVPLAFAGLLVTSIMGIGMYLVAEVFERRMTGWATRGTDGIVVANQG